MHGPVLFFMKRGLVLLFLLSLFLITIPIQSQVQAVQRITPTVNDSPTFSWSKSYSFEHGSFAVAAQVPMGFSFTGLPNKIMPGESFSVDIGTGFGTGATLTVGGTSFSLDPAIPLFQQYVRQVDLRPVAKLVIYAVSDLANVIEPGSGLIINAAADVVLRNTELYLINQFIIDIEPSGPISTSITSCDVWSGTLQTFSANVNPTAQRGQTASLAFKYRYVLTLHIDFANNLYESELVGWIFKKIASVLKLPWEPSLGFNLPTSQPSISSRVIIPDFTISASTSTINIRQGDSGDVTINLSPIDEFDSTVFLEAVGVPAGCLATFSSTSPVPPTSSTMRLSTTLSAPEGSHTISIVGEGGGKTYQTSVTVVITTPPPKPTPTPTPTQTLSQLLSPSSQSEGDQSLFLVVLITFGVLAAIVFLVIASTRSRERRRAFGITTPKESSFRPIVYSSKGRPMYIIPKGKQFCPFCGGILGSKDKFCSNCGSSIGNR